MQLSQNALHAMQLPQTFIPAHLRESVKLYVEHGIPTGNFIEAIIEADLIKAVKNTVHAGHIASVTEWFMQHAPVNCWMNENNRRGWIDARSRDRRAA